MERLQNEGNVYGMVELILQNGQCRNLVHGWSKAFLISLEENDYEEISEDIRPSELIYKISKLNFSAIASYYYKLLLR